MRGGKPLLSFCRLLTDIAFMQNEKARSGCGVEAPAPERAFACAEEGGAVHTTPDERG
jgi:hypothetical protein